MISHQNIFSIIRGLCLVVIASVFQIGHSQDLRAQFDEFLKAKDTVGQASTLIEWQARNENDPELYVARFNYYYSNSAIENSGYDRRKLQYAMETIDEAIAKFPNRLDMRFGKIYLLGELSDWKRFTDEIVRTLQHSDTIKNAWTWRDSKPVDDPQKFMLGSIQGYFNQLYEANDDSLLADMGRISETVLRYYPEDLTNLMNLSVLYMLDKKFDDALPLLLKAEKIDPKDTVVMGNIAMCYVEVGRPREAVPYYEKMMRIGNEYTKDFARERLDKIKRKK